MNKLYVGMDVSQDDVKVYILDQEGNEATQRFCVDNNPQGAETIVNNILKCCHSSYNIFVHNAKAFVSMINRLPEFNW